MMDDLIRRLRDTPCNLANEAASEIENLRLALGYVIHEQGGAVLITDRTLQSHDGFTLGRSDNPTGGIEMTATPRN